MADKTPPSCKLGRVTYAPDGAPETAYYAALTQDEAGNPVVILAEPGTDPVTGKIEALANTLIQQLPELAHRHPHTITWYVTHWLRDIERAAAANLTVDAHLNRIGVSCEDARTLQQLTFQFVRSEAEACGYRLFGPAFSQPEYSCETLLRSLETAYERLGGVIR